MNRFDLACAVISEAQNFNGFVYGGFVRDLFLKDKFNDVNIFIPYKTSRDKILNLLNIPNTYFNFKCAFDSSYHEDLFHEVYKITYYNNTNICFNVNLCHTTSEVSSPFVKDTDVDINYLSAKLINQSFTTKFDKCIEEYKYDSIIQCINKKEFYTTNKTSFDRIRNLEQKGYKNLSANKISMSSYDPISAKPKCIHCNGTKVLDFEFYTRTCFECD